MRCSFIIRSSRPEYAFESGPSLQSVREISHPVKTEEVAGSN